MQKSASIQPRTSPLKFGGKLFNIIHSCPYSGPPRPETDARVPTRCDVSLVGAATTDDPLFSRNHATIPFSHAHAITATRQRRPAYWPLPGLLCCFGALSSEVLGQGREVAVEPRGDAAVAAGRRVRLGRILGSLILKLRLEWGRATHH